MRSLKAFLLDCLVLAVLLAAAYLAYQNRYPVLDWYYLRSYTPSTQIAHLADQATLTDSGRKLFYRADPHIDASRKDLVGHCRISSDKTIELGCYLSTDQIYLLNISDIQLQPQMVVTAAHETLHAVYDRMGSKEKRQLNARLEAYAATITDDDFKSRMEDYAKTEPGEEDNELHSIIGTEYSNLPADLEQHYAQYFANRSQVVTYSQQFKQTFDGLHAEINQLDAEIKTRKATMQNLLDAGSIRQYNALVPTINAEISEYNQKVQQYNKYSADLLGTESAAGTQ